MGISKDLTLSLDPGKRLSSASFPSIKLLLHRSVKRKCLKPIPVYELEPTSSKAYSNFKDEGRL